MLHFLRRIRQSLINSGATRKYLLYAVGEILLVMVGILLALQVNNWNEKQKLKKTEINYLKALVKEMKGNQILLNESLGYHRTHNSSWINILYNWDKLSDDEKMKNFQLQTAIVLLPEHRDMSTTSKR